MSSVEKVKIVDSRIMQPAPKYAVNEGAVSVSNSPFQAISASSSSMSFNINVPSKNIFMDRTMSITTGVRMRVTVSAPNITDAMAGNPILRFGSNCALPAFPLQSLMNSLSVTINNATVTANQKDIIYELLRLTNMKENHLQRTTPTMLDKYANYNDANELDNNPLHGFGKALESDNVPNGAYTNVMFTDENGNEIDEPVFPAAQAGPFQTIVYYTYAVTEKLVLSPFIFSEEEADAVGLYGINNMQVIANFGDQSRNLRIFTGQYEGVIYNNVSFASTNPFVRPTINCIFRTPSLSVPLPSKSVIPYMETPRYITSNNGLTIAGGQRVNLTSNTLVLSQIPDMLLIYVKPGVNMPPNYGDFYLPIDSISLNFDNVSGLMSSMTREQLFDMSVRNNLNMDYNQFLGSARVDNQGAPIPLVGGFLVIRPGIDFALSSGSAPGLGGNYTLQFTIGVKNTLPDNVENPVLYCMAVNSGFFETENGTSRVTTAPLTETDVINAPVTADSQELARMVGGSFWSKIGSTLKKIVKNPVVKDVAKAVSKGAKSLARSSKNPYAMAGADAAEAMGLGKSTGGKGLKALM